MDYDRYKQLIELDCVVAGDETETGCVIDDKGYLHECIDCIENKIGVEYE